MITLAWRSLLSRKLSILAALLSIVAGSSLVTATLLVASSQEQQGAASVTSWRFGNVDAVVMPPAIVKLNSGLALELPSMPRLTAQQIDEIRNAPGVTSLTTESPIPAYLVAPDGTVVGNAFARSWGHPWSTAVADSASFIRGRAPVRPDEVAVDASVAQTAGVGVGDRVSVVLAEGPQDVTVSGVVTRPGEQFEHAVFFSDATAARHGGAPVAALVSLTSAEALRYAVPDLQVLTGEDRAGALQLDLRQAELAGGSSQFLMVIAFLALTVAIFVISSTLIVSIGQRRRELAMLRVVGTRPRLIRRMITWEAIFIGALGGVLGAVGGVALAEVALEFFVAQGLTARGAVVSVEPLPLVAGAAAALAVALVAAWLPARRATRIDPLDALRESEVQPVGARRSRTAFGWLLLATAAVCLMAVFLLGGPVTTLAGTAALFLVIMAFTLLVVAAVLLGPTLLSAVLTASGQLLRRWFAGFAAERSIRSDLRRAAGVSVPLTLLVAVSAVVLFQDSANYQARSHVYADQVTADVVVTGGVQLGVPLSAISALDDVPGVAAASGSISSQLIFDDPPTMRSNGTVTGVDPADLDRVLDYEVVSGTWAGFTEGSIAVSEIVADEKGWDIGDTVAFLYPDGTPGTAVLSTIHVDPMGVSDTVLPLQALVPHVLEPFASAVYVALEPGSETPDVLTSINTALADVAPGAHAVDREEHLAQVAAQASGDNWIILMMVIILGGYAGVSAINVLVASTMSRRREFALYRLAGARRRQIVVSLLVETLVVGTTAVVAGTVVATGTMIGYGYLLTDTVWVPFVGPTYLVIVGCAYLAALIGTLAPVRSAMTAEPLAGVRAW
ncbi:FtsX-like permease family protein [Promicromonospora sp. NPDC057488]|uniref:FtsX-like permease family protein n=1 Tax=Promicromonospora sp. NPDC057488 TaxID=3346147 RepID=UPI003672EFB3